VRSRSTDSILLVTWARLSELASADAMREAIRRVRALVRRNGPTFSSSPSISGDQQRQAAAGDALRWMRGNRRGIKRAASAPAVEQVRRPVGRRSGWLLRGLLSSRVHMCVYWTPGYWARPSGYQASMIHLQRAEPGCCINNHACRSLARAPPAAGAANSPPTSLLSPEILAAPLQQGHGARAVLSA
jgi:hypothetical protein